MLHDLAAYFDNLTIAPADAAAGAIRSGAPGLQLKSLRRGCHHV